MILPNSSIVTFSPINLSHSVRTSMIADKHLGNATLKMIVGGTYERSGVPGKNCRLAWQQHCYHPGC